MSKFDRKKSKNDDENTTLKRVIMILIIIIIILLLITSCSSIFFGKIGNLFDGSSNYEINENNHTLEKIYDQNLKFVKKDGNTFLDEVYKIEFSVDGFDSKKVKCTTSDSKIATCIVRGNYVEVHPIKKGKVTIYITAKVNGKEYIGTHKLTIENPKRKIVLSKNSGIINLMENHTIEVFYHLTNLTGNVRVVSSNSKVATATAKNGILTIKAHKTGKAIITLIVEYRNRQYKVNYEVTVISKKDNSVYHNDSQKKNESQSSSSGSSNDHNQSQDNIVALKNLKIDGFELKPNFNYLQSNYKLEVKYNTSAIKFIPELTSGSTIECSINNKNGTNNNADLNNLELAEGENVVTLVAINKFGEKKVYEIVITKPVRKVVVNREIHSIYIEDKTTDIIYNIVEDQVITTDYKISDVFVEVPGFNGDVKVTKGKISLTPVAADLGKTYEVKVKYLDKVDKISIDVKSKLNKYYAIPTASQYNFSYYDGQKDQNIILNTNIFADTDLFYEDTINGIKLYNDRGYVLIESSDVNVLKVKFDPSDNKNATNYISFLNELKGEGDVILKVSGNVYGEDIESSIINVSIKSKYNIVIDAIDGFFNSFVTKYEELRDANDVIDLKNYIAYKVDKSGNCMYYELDSWNTSMDGSGDRYNLDDLITVDKDLTLYAIYKESSKYIELKEDNIMYLTDVDLFHNDEYYVKYNKDKIIYPGAHGDHTAYIKNNTASTIVINKVNILEDTVCVDHSNCLNMGYIIKYTKRNDDKWYYYYGENKSYSILNQDTQVVRDHTIGYKNSITLPNNRSLSKDSIILNPSDDVAIAILWQWVDIDDILDTKIGSINRDQKYTITVSFEYSKTDKYCKMSN